jgi:hypothetical protein
VAGASVRSGPGIGHPGELPGRGCSDDRPLDPAATARVVVGCCSHPTAVGPFGPHDGRRSRRDSARSGPSTDPG